MTQYCASLTHFAFGADLITQSDSIKYLIFNGTVAYIITCSENRKMRPETQLHKVQQPFLPEIRFIYALGHLHASK